MARRQKLKVYYNNARDKWFIDNGAAVLKPNSQKKEKVIKQARKEAKKDYIRPSKLVIENKDGSVSMTHKYD